MDVLHGTDDVLSGVAYLRNATDDGVDALLGYPQDDHGRLFTGRHRGDSLAQQEPG